MHCTSMKTARFGLALLCGTLGFLGTESTGRAEDGQASIKKLLALQQAEIQSLKNDIAELRLQQDTRGTFTIPGSADTFYPVWFADSSRCWNDGEARLRIVRASIHKNGTWAGSLVARFEYHGTWWGNGSSYLDAAIDTSEGSGDQKKGPFLADFEVPYYPSGVVVWLRGGGLSYDFVSNCGAQPVFDVTKPIVIYPEAQYRQQRDKVSEVSQKVKDMVNGGWKRHM